MRLCLIGHSLIHPRQYLFIDELRRQELEVLEIYPEHWGNNHRAGGFSIDREDFEKYTFGNDALTAIKNFKPDLILTYAEWWQYQAYRSTRWARSLNVPHILFCWENLRKPELEHKILLNKQALVICGNKKAEEIARPYCNTVVLPQVGVRSDIFCIKEKERAEKVLFVGRPVPEKGIAYVEKLEKDGYDVTRATGIDYLDMPRLYNKARVLIVPSLTTTQWVEQYAPFASIEAMLCGTSVVAFKSGAISEWLSGSPAKLVDEGDYEGLKRGVDYFLSKWNLDLAWDCRKWALFLAHERIAEEYINFLREVKRRHEMDENIDISRAVEAREDKKKWFWWQEYDFTHGGKDTDRNSLTERSRVVSIGMLGSEGLVLDAGCCGGWLSLEIAKKGNKVVGLDLPKVIRQAIPQNRGMLVAGDACEMPFKKEVFDAIYASELIEHLFEPENFVAECYRILKPNKKIIICTPWDKEASLCHPTHRAWFNKDTLTELLQKHNFEVKRIETISETRIIVVEGIKR